MNIRQHYSMKMTVGIAACLCITPPAHAGSDGWGKASSIARDTLIAAALGVPAVQSDWNGTAQAAGSMGAATLLTYGLKEGFPEWRPDHSDRKSFPSGHTSVSFAAAATLENRYGWQAGIPAHIAALFVGIARVKADKHHWYDVAAGAVLGEASGLIITHRHDERVQYFPWADSDGGGVAISMRF